MKLSRLLSWLLAPFMLPIVEEGGGGAGDKPVDRGDELPVKEDKTAAEDAAAELARIEKEKEEEAAAAKAGKEEKDPEEEEDPDEDGKEKKENKRADTRVPLKRHKELLEKERRAREAVEAELAQFKGGEQVAKVNEKIGATETKLVEMETEYTKLLVDGKTAEAAKLMSDIRKLERTIGEQRADMRAAEAEARAVERVRYDTMVERLEAAYTVLNPDHEDYDEDQTKDVLDLMEVYKRRGMAPADAIQQAAKKLLKAENVKQEKAVNTDVKIDKEAVAAERKAAAIKRNVETSNKQPAGTDKAGVDSDKHGGALTAENAMKMPYEEFSKLTEAELARVRGDSL